ncbi:hypothetical protein MtrunA17_Chr5g0413631 [Medicago truncatula]|uniref:Transmembrane protein n=1 Tax=Medicago truncatula TaxID=3880 RepID=A0A396HNZ6_MEDTR|nr:hypothetical protein MtrunA17_Chr5g0413631 [Medicago truncatula]
MLCYFFHQLYQAYVIANIYSKFARRCRGLKATQVGIIHGSLKHHQHYILLLYQIVLFGLFLPFNCKEKTRLHLILCWI